MGQNIPNKDIVCSFVYIAGSMNITWHICYFRECLLCLHIGLDRQIDEQTRYFKQLKSLAWPFNSADLKREQGMIKSTCINYILLKTFIKKKEWNKKNYKNHENVKWKKYTW